MGLTETDDLFLKSVKSTAAVSFFSVGFVLKFFFPKIRSPLSKHFRKRIQPFWIEEEAKKIPTTNYINGGMFKPFAVRDGRLITGQQQFSGAAAARLVIEALGV